MTRLITVIVALLLGNAALGQSCVPHWSDEFYPSGTDGEVNCMAVFDDGHGPRLYIGGTFQHVGRALAPGLASWNGTALTPVTGVPLEGVISMATLDAGSGSRLYVESYSGTYSWNGIAWGRIGASDPFLPSLLAVHDEGAGPSLYAVGRSGGVPSPFVARWTGTVWERMGGAFEAPGSSSLQLSCLASIDSGSGPHLYVGGNFASVGGQSIAGLAWWDGATWRRVGQGLDSLYANPIVGAIAAYDDGSGPGLWAGVNFGTTNILSPGLARFDGASWRAFSAAHPMIGTMTVAPTPNGSRLFAAGWLRYYGPGDDRHYTVGMWDGGDWVPVGAPDLASRLTQPRALAAFEDGAGSKLFVGGNFAGLAGAPADNIAAWNGTAWESLVVGSGLDYRPETLAWFDDGRGPALYAGGSFLFAGGQPISGLARWDGHQWSPADPRFRGSVESMVTFDDGRGAALYVSGSFDGDVPELPRGLGIARWDGTTWEPLASPFGGPWYVGTSWLKLGVADDPGGSALYVGGDFQGVVARLEGSQFRTLPGLNDDWEPFVTSFASFREGGASVLYVGGALDIDGDNRDHRLVRWDGQAWSAATFDPTGTVYSLLVTHSPAGDTLYVGGQFSSQSPVPINGLAAWNGTTWSAVGNLSYGSVSNLGIMDDGSGPGLIVGGSLGTPDQYIYGLGKWDGQVWTRLGTAQAGANQEVIIVNGPAGQSLFAGGGTMGGINYWIGCPLGSCYANCDGSTASGGEPSLNVGDFVCFLNLFAAGDPNANCDQSATPPILNVSDFICFLNRFAAGCP